MKRMIALVLSLLAGLGLFTPADASVFASDAFGAVSVSGAEVSGSVSVSAARAVVMDADTGATLYARSADVPGLIASTTKIMTGYLVCLAGDLDRPVRVPAEAVGVEGSSMYLREGETLTREELLYGAMLRSGNDAALALAIDCAGDEAAFVRRMNETAKELGLSRTIYANPHGLDSKGGRSTARDLAVLTAAALENETFRRIVSTRSVTVSGDRILTNHNRLLWRYAGCIGVKTGYTRAAGRILVSAAERGGRRLICVTMDDPDDWRDHTALLDWAFSKYEPRTVAVKDAVLLPSSGPNRRDLAAEEDLTLSVREGETLSLRFVPGLASDLLPGAHAGTVMVLIDGKAVAEVPVCWGKTRR